MGVGDNALMGYASYMGVAQLTGSAYGTHVTATAYFEFNSEAFKRNIERKYLESMNTTRNFRTAILLNETVEGSLECPLNVAADGNVFLLNHVMGGTVTSSQIAATVAYKHIVVEGDMSEPTSACLSFTIRKGGDDDKKWQYDGMRVNTLTLKGEIGSEVIMSAELVGQTASITTDTNTAAFTNVLPMDYTNVTVLTGDTTTTFSATTYTGFELTINNNLISDTNARSLGSRTLAVLPPSRREVSLKLTQRFDTISAHNLGMTTTAKAFKILIDTGVTIGAAGSSTYSMHVILPRCHYAANQPEIGDFGIITHELEMTAIQDTTASYAIQMQIHNATTTYEV